MSDLEARARLSSILDMLEHEAQALQGLHEPRLTGVLEQITVLRAEIVAALAELHHGLEPNGDSGF